jgi:DNA-binding transcriptional LysR family regulator
MSWCRYPDPWPYCDVDPRPSPGDLRCFGQVATLLSFSRAAARLGLSQPAVSQAVSRLERLTGLRLFERTSREVQLTPAGKALVPYAEAVLQAYAELADEAGRLAEPVRPTIRLAYPPLVGGWAARIARRLARIQPAVEVDLRPAGWRVATAELVQGEVPAAILSAPFPAGFTTTARCQLPVRLLAVPVGDRLATARPAVRPDQLARRTVLLPRHRPAGGVWARLAARLPGSSRIRATGDDLDDVSAVLDLVAAGFGVLAVPDLVGQTSHRRDVRFVAFDAGDLRVTYGLAFRAHHASAELIALVQAVQETLRTR